MIRRLLRPGLCAIHTPFPLQAPPPLLVPRQRKVLKCCGSYDDYPHSSSRYRLPQPSHHSGITTARTNRSSSSNSATASTSATCWKCGREITTMNRGKVLFFCPCDKRVILPPTVTNYFKILECEDVRVDTSALKKKHTQLQRELHPDKFSIKSQKEREYSAEQSALVNDAYSTLSKPYSRGLYLMELNGVTISESDNYVASGESGQHLEFLEEVMELRGEIHHLENSPNPDLTQVKQLWEKNNAQVQAYTSEFEDCYEKGDLDGAKEALSKMKYYVTNSEMLYPLLPDE